MKRVLLLVIIGMGIFFSQLQAQNTEYVFPQHNEFIGNYYAYPSGGPIYYNYTAPIKVKPNTTIEFNLSTASFWFGCTNYVWYLNLPGGASTATGRDITLNLSGNTGWAMISIDAIDKDGVRHRNCSFSLEITNDL